MGVVETEISPADTDPQTPSEWFDANVRAAFHVLIENVLLRSESEKTVLHALVDDLDKDPQEVISKLEIAPINTGGGGYVDPILAQVLADNASLRGDVKALLDEIKNARADTTAEAVEETTEVPPPVETTPIPPLDTPPLSSGVTEPPPLTKPTEEN